MRQAFDEVVVHSRMDVKDEQAKAQVRELKLAELQQEALQEGEKQKALVLAYVNYVKQRNDEILTAMEDSQEAERCVAEYSHPHAAPPCLTNDSINCLCHRQSEFICFNVFNNSIFSCVRIILIFFMSPSPSPLPEH